MKRFTSVDVETETLNGKTYYNSLKKQPVTTMFASPKLTKKELVIPSDEGQFFAEIPSLFNEKKLDLMYTMEWPMTRNHGSFLTRTAKAEITRSRY